LDVKVILTPGGASRHGSHQLADACRCERKWYLRYVLGIQPKIEAAPNWGGLRYKITGTLFHACLAYHYASRMDVKPDWFDATSLAEALDEIGKGYPSEIRAALEMYEAYRLTYAADPIKPIAVEHEYTLTLSNGAIVTTRVDLLGEANGEYWVFDYKTSGDRSRNRNTGRLWGWNPDRGDYAIDWQSMLALNIVRANLGADKVRGWMIQRALRDPPFDFDRNPLVIPLAPYEETIKVAEACVERERDILTRTARGEKPRPAFWACTRPYTCDMLPICLARDDAQRRIVLETEFKREPVDLTPVTGGSNVAG